MTLKEFFETDYFKQLVFDANCYNALEGMGVDNWEGYCFAYEEFCRMADADSIDKIVDEEIRLVKEKYLND